MLKLTSSIGKLSFAKLRGANTLRSAQQITGKKKWNTQTSETKNQCDRSSRRYNCDSNTVSSRCERRPDAKKRGNQQSTFWKKLRDLVSLTMRAIRKRLFLSDGRDQRLGKGIWRWRRNQIRKNRRHFEETCEIWWRVFDESPLTRRKPGVIIDRLRNARGTHRLADKIKAKQSRAARTKRARQCHYGADIMCVTLQITLLLFDHLDEDLIYAHCNYTEMSELSANSCFDKCVVSRFSYVTIYVYINYNNRSSHCSQSFPKCIPAKSLQKAEKKKKKK